MGAIVDRPDSASPSLRRWPRVVWWGGAVLLILALGGAGFWWYSYRPARKAEMARQMTDAGVKHWRDGDTRRAELSFASAAQLDPHARRPVLLRARMLLNSPQRERGREIFRSLLDAAPAAERESIAANYHDALVCVGWWNELAALAVAELGRAQRPSTIWIDSALAAVRLARWNEADWTKMPSATRLDRVSSALLGAQVALNEARAHEAAARLAEVDRPLSPTLSLTLARMWLRMGDGTRARLALARVDAELSDLEGVLGEILLTQTEPAVVKNLLRDLAALTASSGGGKAIDVALANLLPAPHASVAARLSDGAAAAASKLDDSLVSALWLYCSLAGAEQATGVWASELGRRFGKWPIKIRAGKLDERTALFVLNSFPFSRELVVGIMEAAVPVQPKDGFSRAADVDSAARPHVI